jgi:hypothetical protein
MTRIFEPESHGNGSIIAAIAMHAMLSDELTIHCMRKDAKSTAETLARDAWIIADAMLKERE